MIYSNKIRIGIVDGWSKLSKPSGMYIGLLIAAVALLALSCSDDLADMDSGRPASHRNRNASAKKREPKNIDNKKAESPSAQNTVSGEEKSIEKDYVYTSIGKRDPFKSIFDEANNKDVLEKDEVLLSPLQSYDVASFVVKAIIWGISSPTAIIASPDGKTYVVKTGTLIGRHWGRVVKIKHNALVVLEQSPLPNGTKVSNLIELELPVETIKPTDELSIDEEVADEEEKSQEELIKEYEKSVTN